MKSAIKPILSLFFLLNAGHLVSQCPTSGAAWMEKIVAIEDMDDGPAKINALIELQLQHVRCNAPKDSILARMLHRLGNQYSRMGDQEKAINYTKQAVAINSSSIAGAQQHYLANSYFNLGLSYATLNLFPEAGNYFDSCVKIALKHEKTNLVVMGYAEEVFAFYRAADYQKAIDVADRAILFAKPLQHASFEARMQMQKAQAALELGNIAEAEKSIQLAFPVVTGKDFDTISVATAYSIYAKLLRAKKDPKQAIVFYKKAFALNKKIGRYEQCVRDMLDLGIIYDEDLGDLANAITCYDAGLKMNDGKYPYQASGLFINMGSAYWRRRDYHKALECYQKSLRTFPIGFTGDDFTDNPTTAMLKLSGNDYFLYTLLYNKAEALLDLGKKEKANVLLQTALNTFRLADKMVDQMRWRQYSEQSKLHWRARTKKMYERAIETCYLLNLPEDAFFFFEKSRAVLLNDKLNELGATRFLPPAEINKEKELRLRMLLLQQQLSSASPEAKQQFYNAQDEFEKYLRTLEKRYASYYHYKYDTTIHTVTDIRNSLLQNGQSLIEYFTGDSAIYILAVTPGRTALEQVRFKEYTAVTKELLALVSDKSVLNQHYARYRSLAYTLYNRLFSNLGIPTGGRVIISPDDHFIPFELFVTDTAGNNSFLVKKHAFSYTYSAGFLMKRNGQEQPLYSHLLGIAPVNYQSHLSLPPLDGADGSLKNIGGYFSSASYLINKDATKQHFLDRMPSYPVVHLYSHANADSLDAEPVLYFSDSVLRLTELQALGNLDTRLVVLSACNTGLGKNIRGEGIFSLARGFAAVGIPATVTNIWQIDNQATYKLTELFYKYLNQGLPGDMALQRAKLDFLQANKDEEMPYYWAASLFMGKAEVLQQDKPAGAMTYIWGGIGLLLVGGVGFWMYKRRRA